MTNAQQGMPGAPAALLRRFDPVTFALERIARQRDPASRFSREQLRKTNRESSFVRSGHRSHERAVPSRCVARRWGQARQHYRRRRLRRLRPSQDRHRREYRLRTDLHHQIHLEVRQCPDAAGERHRFPGMPLPVSPVQRLAGLHRTARQVADQGEGGRLDRHIVQGCFQRVQGRIHQGAVEGLGRVQSPDPDSLRFEALRNGFNVRHWAADDLVGSIVSRDAQPDTG